MRLLFLFLISAMTLSAHAAERITLTIQVIDVPAGHDELTVNGDARLWTNSATATPQSLVTIGADAGESATNLFLQIAKYPYAGPLDLNFTAPDTVTLKGQTAQAMAASISGTWATLSYSTQTVATMTGVRVPISSEPSSYTRTNVATHLVEGLEDYSQVPFTAGTTLLQNIVQTTGANTIAGNLTIDATTTFTAANAITSSETTILNNTPALDFYEEDEASGARRWRIYADNELLRFAILDDAVGSALTDVFWMARDGDVWAPNGDVNANVVGSITDSDIIGETDQTGDHAYARVNHTTLANGNNAAVTFGEKVYAKIKAGPTAAFAICGLADGRDGRILIIQNATGQNMTIANDSGVDPTAANRIYTQTGSDVATTGNGTATLIYDSEDSRWILVSVQQ